LAERAGLRAAVPFPPFADEPTSVDDAIAHWRQRREPGFPSSRRYSCARGASACLFGRGFGDSASAPLSHRDLSAIIPVNGILSPDSGSRPTSDVGR
jgi:hypothetical protein